MYLLFINALKGLKKKKVQMLAIIVMVLLSTAIYTTMNTSLDRLEDRYYNYLKEQNVEQFSFSINEDTTVEKLNEIAKKYDFSYELEQSKISIENNYIYKAIPYNKEKKINIPYLIEGNMPKNDNEITVLPNFAKKNNLEIGDKYKIGDKEYKIVGYAYSPDHIYPMLSMSSPIFDEKYNNIMYMNSTTYEIFNGISDDNYVATYNYPYDYKLDIMVTTGNSENELSFKSIFDNEKDININANTMIRMMRTSMLQGELVVDRQFATYFLDLLLVIAVIIIVIITKKRIDDERLQIGVLKSLGYNRFSIAISYLVYPIIGSLIGGLLGYLIGIFLNEPMTSLYLNYFTVPLDNFKFNIKYLITCILLPMTTLSILSYLVAIFMLKKKPLDLLKEGSNLRVNHFSKLVNKLTKKLSFNRRFRYSLASRSIGKLLIVALTSFSTGMLIVLTLIGMNLFNSLIDKSFDGLSFKYMVSYNNIMLEEDKSSDMLFSTSLTLNSIKDENNKEKALDKDDISISIYGIDNTAKKIELLDKEKNNIIKNIDNGIIINTNISDTYNIVIGDTLIFNYNGSLIEYKVAGINDSYMGKTAYVKRNTLCENLGLPISYNVKYSNDSKYGNMSKLDQNELKMIGNIFSIDDLKNNMSSQMETFNASIYIVISFASLMALVIIGVIANIIVEENKKTISLMKVMGYKNKEITSIVLNIYTPVVVIAYLLSIPAMISLLKIIVKMLTTDMEMQIPITLSPVLALIGLIGLLLAYFIAINISRRVLNKVPLAIALKRE